MNLILPNDYILSKFFQYSGFPKHNKHNNTYQACCPICREDNGKYWGKRKRLYYFPNEMYLYCHNCNKSWSTVNWIKEVSHISYNDILKELKDGDYEISASITPATKLQKRKIETLPEDSINLCDDQQLKFYQNNTIIQDCLEFIKKRNIDKAINKPKAFYVSLTDYIHKNRLCIPFYDEKEKIIFYQTRAIYKKDEEKYPKYLSKLDGDKTIFGISSIDSTQDYIFIFEGPIDAMFIKNGVALGGTNLSNKQEEQLKSYKLYQKIWIPDCQYVDPTGKKVTKDLLDRGERVFIWPKKYSAYKDINDVCIKYKLYQISAQFIYDNSFIGAKGLLELTKIP